MRFRWFECNNPAFRCAAAKKCGVISNITPDIKNTPIAADVADTPAFGLHLTIRIVAPHVGVIRAKPNWLCLRNHGPNRRQIELDSRSRSVNG